MGRYVEGKVLLTILINQIMNTTLISLKIHIKLKFTVKIFANSVFFYSNEYGWPNRGIFSIEWVLLVYMYKESRVYT